MTSQYTAQPGTTRIEKGAIQLLGTTKLSNKDLASQGFCPECHGKLGMLNNHYRTCQSCGHRWYVNPRKGG